MRKLRNFSLLLSRYSWPCLSLVSWVQQLQALQGIVHNMHTCEYFVMYSTSAIHTTLPVLLVPTSKRLSPQEMHVEKLHKLACVVQPVSTASLLSLRPVLQPNTTKTHTDPLPFIFVLIISVSIPTHLLNSQWSLKHSDR